MKKNYLLFITALVCSYNVYSQNVAINSTGAAPNASAGLDISFTDRGFLVPRMTAAQRTAIASPATGLLVYQTNAGTQGQGFYFYNGTVWVPWSTNSGGWGLAGNTLGGGEFMGSTNAQPVLFYSNNTERMRMLSSGEVVIGSTTATSGDLFSAYNSAALTWGINGYSSQNGSAVYGSTNAGTNTLYASVQGEYFGSNSNGAGVRGIVGSNVAGTGFNNIVAGVSGSGALAAASSGTYKFGVYGSGGYTSRGGGVMGYDFGVAMGALGYYANNGNDYAVYGFSMGHTNGVGGGRLIASDNPVILPSNVIGLGIQGGVMGGWIKGDVYGTNLSGAKYGVYVHGNTITNQKFVQLNTTAASDERIASYATTALTNELTAKGKVNLQNGKATVMLDERLVSLCDPNSIIVTATPMGNCNGVFISEIRGNTFVIQENNIGMSNVAVSFIISGTLKNQQEFTEADILNKKYEENMNGVMQSDANSDVQSTPIWFDGQNVRHDAVDNELTGRNALKEKNEKEAAALFKPAAKKK